MPQRSLHLSPLSDFFFWHIIALQQQAFHFFCLVGSTEPSIFEADELVYEARPIFGEPGLRTRRIFGRPKHLTALLQPHKTYDGKAKTRATGETAHRGLGPKSHGVFRGLLAPRVGCLGVLGHTHIASSGWGMIQGQDWDRGLSSAELSPGVLVDICFSLPPLGGRLV